MRKTEVLCQNTANRMSSVVLRCLADDKSVCVIDEIIYIHRFFETIHVRLSTIDIPRVLYQAIERTDT